MFHCICGTLMTSSLNTALNIIVKLPITSASVASVSFPLSGWCETSTLHTEFHAQAQQDSFCSTTWLSGWLRPPAYTWRGKSLAGKHFDGLASGTIRPCSPKSLCHSTHHALSVFLHQLGYVKTNHVSSPERQIGWINGLVMYAHVTSGKLFCNSVLSSEKWWMISWGNSSLG